MKTSIVLILNVLLVFACTAQAPESSMATLDAFAGSGLGTSCSATEDKSTSVRILFGEDVMQSRRAELKKSTEKALSAVPVNLQRYFSYYGGSIKISSVAGRICSDAFRSEDSDFAVESEDVAGCVSVLKDADDRQEDVAIVIKDSSAEIEAQLVRSFGYYIAQYLSRLHRSESGTIELATFPNDGFRQQRTLVARQFLTDLARSQTFDLKHMESFLGSGSKEILLQNMADGKDVYEHIEFRHPGEKTSPEPDTRAARLEAFEGFVFANSFDSMFCNNWATNLRNTRNNFSKYFPKTFLQFETFYSEIDDIVSQLPINKIQKSAGFGLQTTDASSAPTGNDVVTSDPAAVSPNNSIGNIGDNFVVGDTSGNTNPNGLPTVDLVVTNDINGNPIFDVSGDPTNINIDTSGFVVNNPPPAVNTDTVVDPVGTIQNPSVSSDQDLSVQNPNTQLPELVPPATLPDSQINGVTPVQTPVQQPQPVAQPVQQQQWSQPLHHWPQQSFHPSYPSSGCGGGYYGGGYGGGYGSGYWGG